MIKTAKNFLLTFSLLLLPIVASAQVDSFGHPDTLYAELAQIDAQNWSITVSLTNDEPVVALSVPFKMTAGPIRIVADSAIYNGGRVKHFDFKNYRPDTTIQCVTLGMIATLTPVHKFLEPGNGRLVTIFVSSLNGEAVEKLTIDTTTTSPNNSLMVVADIFQGTDTIGADDRERMKIYPVFVIKE